MPQKFYDEFSRLSLDKMAKSMEDITFTYKETKVPKAHYKKELSRGIEEFLEGSVELNLIETYYRTLEQLVKQNPKWFFQALLCLDLGIKPGTIAISEYQALEVTWNHFSAKKKAARLDTVWIEKFKEINTNGASYTVSKEEK